MSDDSRRHSFRPWAIEWTSSSHAAYNSEFWTEWWKKATIRWDHAVLAWEEYDRPFLANTRKEDVILEAGCGSCGVVKFLEDHGRRFVVGVDFSFETLSNVRRADPNMKLVVGDIRRLPFRRNSFDCLFSLGVVEYFTEGPEKMIREMHDFIKPTGRMIFTVPYLNPIERLSQIMDPQKRPGSDQVFYQYLFRVREVRGLLTTVGFRIVGFEYCNRLGVLYHYFCRMRDFYRRRTTSMQEVAPAGAQAIGLHKHTWILRCAQFIPGFLFAMMMLFVCEKQSARPT